MILSQQQIKELIEAPANPVVLTNKKIQDDHKIHIQGSGFESVLKQIIGYESVEDFKRKKILSKPFSRPLFKKIVNAQSRWKTSWGTTKYYTFKKNSEGLSAEFKKEILSQVWKGGSIEKLIKDFLSKAFYEEFNSFLLVEKGQRVEIGGVSYEQREGIIKPIGDADQLKPYIIFLSIDDVHSFKITGNKVEFIILKYGKINRNGNDIDLFRAIDDRNDYVFEKENNIVRLSSEHNIIEHKAGRCPASVISYVNKNLTDDRTKTSPVDQVIELFDYYLHQFAEHLVTEVLHAHPIYYQLGQECRNMVDGNRCDHGRFSYQKNGEDIEIECPSCRGTGHNLRKDASTVIVLPAKDDEGKAFNITNVAGYVTTDVQILEHQEKSIDWMEEKILSSALGINNVAQSEKLEKTATEAMINLKPLEDIISEIIDMVEGIESTLTDIIGKMYYGDKYLGSEIIYGRKLSLRDENVLIKEIQESKKAGVSNSHIKSLNEELTYSRFIKSNYDLARNSILNKLEPLIGFSFEEVEASENISKETKLLKQNFNDLIERFEQENGDIVEFEKENEKKVLNIMEKLLSYLAVKPKEPVVDFN